MRSPSLVVLLGLLTLSPSLGCVGATKVRNASRSVLAAVATAASGVDRMDAACQSSASSAPALRACREPRDEAMKALSTITLAIGSYAP